MYVVVPYLPFKATKFPSRRSKWLMMASRFTEKVSGFIDDGSWFH